MPVIVHNETDHVEQRDEPCVAIKFHADVVPWWAQRQPPPPISDRNQEEDNCSEGDSEGEDHSYLPMRSSL